MEFPISVERPGHKCCFMHGGFWLHIVLMMNSHNLFRRSFELKHRKAHESRLLNLTNNSLNYARVSLRWKFMGNKSMAWRIRRQNVSRNRAITFSFLLYPSHYSLFAEPPLNAFLRFLKAISMIVTRRLSCGSFDTATILHIWGEEEKASNPHTIAGGA